MSLGSTPNPVDLLHQRLLKDVKKLRAVVTTAGIPELVFVANSTFQHPPVATTERFGLQSPVRQMFFLLGLALTTPEPAAHGWTDDDLREAHRLLDRIYHTYVEIGIASLSAAAGTEEELELRWHVAGPTLVNHFFTAVIASTEQVFEAVRQNLVPFDAELRDLVGFSATDALNLASWISSRVQQQLDAFTTIFRVFHATWEKSQAQGWSVERAKSEFESDPEIVTIDRNPITAPLRQGRSPLHVSWVDVKAAFGDELAERFADLFISRRGAGQTLTYPTERNPAERAPLFWIASDEAVGLPLVHALAAAILDELSDRLVKSSDQLAKRFHRNRDRALERRTAAPLKQIAAESGGTSLESVAETPDGQLEHDTVVMFGADVLIVEAKAGRLRESLRDPTRAYTRLRDDFRADGGIQKAYEQGERVRRAIEIDRTEVTLYDKTGEEVARLRPGVVERVHTICVTAEEYGAMAADLSLLLEKDDDAPYPLAINIYDLEALVGAFAKKGWGLGELIQYVKERGPLHGKVKSADELEIAAVFILYRSLAPLRDLLALHPEAQVLMDSDSAWVFDAIYTEDHGGHPAQLTSVAPLATTWVADNLLKCMPPRPTNLAVVPNALKNATTEYSLSSPIEAPIIAVGRNAPCPCGSGKKYKKCHGR
jgi:hypothetical protein